MRRKVLMLASTAKQGPRIPHSGSYEIEIEGGERSDIEVSFSNNHLQVYRLHGDNPITVYANCKD